MIASSPTVSARDNAAAGPTGTKQDQHNPFSFSLPKWNNFRETIPGKSLQGWKRKREREREREKKKSKDNHYGKKS